MRQFNILLALVMGSSLLACGGSSDEEAVEIAEPERTSGAERRREPDDGVAVEGLMGTISTLAVQRGMEPRMGRFLSCFANRYDDIPLLGGEILLSFRVRVDGSVLWVFPKESTIGDRETETCILEQAAGIRFSRPQGGEAEFTYPLMLDPPEDVRPPIPWGSNEVAEAVDAQRDSVRECGRGPYQITAYINRGGRVMAAGASTTELERADDLDCVSRAVEGWDMPDPGSYPAKATFSL